MKRLLLASVMALILLGALGESVNSLNRPWSEVPPQGTTGSTSDHPWGGDNVTDESGDGGDRRISPVVVVPSTGIGSVDLVLRAYFYKNISRPFARKTSHVTVTTQPQVTTEVGNSTSTNTGSTSNNGQ